MYSVGVVPSMADEQVHLRNGRHLLHSTWLAVEALFIIVRKPGRATVDRARHHSGDPTARHTRLTVSPTLGRSSPARYAQHVSDPVKAADES